MTKIFLRLISLKERGVVFPQEIKPLLVLILVATVLFTLSPTFFFTWLDLSSILIQASVIAVLAAGMTIVIISGGIDLSVGMVMTLTSSMFGVLVLNLGLKPIPSLLITLLIGGFVGLINGILITKGGIRPFIVTLGMLGITQGFSQIIATHYSMYNLPDTYILLGGKQLFGIIPMPLVIMFFVYLMLFLIIKHTKLGLNAYSIGGNEETARLAGINVDLNKIWIYALNGLLAGVAGMIPSSRIYTANPASGSGFELDAIAAAVIGGASLTGGQGSLIGTLIGALIMSSLKNGLNLLKVSPFVLKVAIGSVIIGAALIDRISKGNGRKKEFKEVGFQTR